MKKATIRVLLVDDSPLALTILKRLLSPAPDVEVVGTALNGREALEMIPRLCPDVLCTDLRMPLMDGLELTRQVMSSHPLPILVISVAVQTTDHGNVFDLIQAGAVDVFPKPEGGLFEESADREAEQSRELIRKIRILAGVRVTRRKHLLPPPAPATPMPWPTSSPPFLVAIAASTGGPAVLQRILSGLPADFGMPVICVQHITAGFETSLVDWLNGHCELQVQTATAGEGVKRGSVYFAPSGSHLEVDGSGRLSLSQESPRGGHRPSADVLFSSVAQGFGSQAVGVVLTGMGADGAEGLLEMARAGAMTIAQDEATSVVYGMPRVAVERGAARLVMNPADIVEYLNGIRNPFRR